MFPPEDSEFDRAEIDRRWRGRITAVERRTGTVMA